MSDRRILRRFSLPLVLAAAALVPCLGLAPAPAHAAGEQYALDEAKNDVVELTTQLKDKKKGNEDLNGTLVAIAAKFFSIKGPGDPAAPTDPNDPAAVAAAQKKHDDEVKKHREAVKAFQADALKEIFRALKLVTYDPRNKENLRNDVNLKAAQVLGDLLADPRLGDVRDAKEVEKLREGWAKDIQALLAGDFEEPRQEYSIPVGVLEATFAILGKLNEHSTLLWLLDNYSHTDNAPAKVERLRAAHKAMVLFKDVKGKTRHAIVEKFVTIYTSREASANNNASQGSDAKARSAAAAAKKFWDDVKTDAIAVVNYYAAAGGQAPVNGDGQALTSMKELNDWFNDHSKVNKAPWLDEKLPDAPK
jgi:hypothetical protein